MNDAVVSPDSPLLYLFLAATLLLTLGYFRGARKNKRRAPAVLDALVAAVKARETQFTTIGGLTGYHATIVPGKRHPVASINATLVLLPRQSLLFMPVALLLGHRDTLAVFCSLDKAAAEGLREGHVVDTTSPTARRTGIEGIERLNTETIQWGGRPFMLHSADEHTAERLKRLIRRLDDPGPLRHLALVPSHDRVFFTMEAEPRSVAKVVKRLYGAIRELLGSR